MKTPFAHTVEEGSVQEALPQANEKSYSFAEVKERMGELSQEFRDLRGDDSAAGVSRRQQIKGQLRVLQKECRRLEPRVEITLPKPSHGAGQPYELSGKFFYGGVRYTVTASEAQQLLHMASQDREAYLKLFTQNGRDVDLGHLGDRARNAEILAEV